VVITELDKKWARGVRTRAIRTQAGERRAQRCAECGKRASSLAPIDWSAPTAVKWLCVRHKNEVGLSQLQRSLLRNCLIAYWRSELDRACSRPDPGCFRIAPLLKDCKDARKRASKRAAAGLAIARLIKRGLLQRCAHRGRWRLSRAGLTLARRLYPEIRCPTRAQLATDIALVRAMSALVR